MTKIINRLFRDQLPEQRIAKIEPLSETRAHAVWKVTTDRSVFAVKHHLFAPLTRGKPYHLLAVEQKVTDHLLASGVSVPQIIATDSDRGLVIYEWCGNHTLDDICQTNDPRPFAHSVLNTLCSLEKAFYNHRSKFILHIAPGCRADDLREQWHNTIQSLTETLPALARDPQCSRSAIDLGNPRQRTHPRTASTRPHRLQRPQHRLLKSRNGNDSRTRQNWLRLARTPPGTIHYIARRAQSPRSHHWPSHTIACAILRAFCIKIVLNASRNHPLPPRCPSPHLSPVRNPYMPDNATLAKY